MKVEQITNNKRYKQNFCSKFKSPLDIEDTYNLLRYHLWWEEEEKFPAKYGKRASLLLNLIHNMTGIEYLNLTEKQKNILDIVSPSFITYDANTNYNLASSLKTYMAQHYGEFKNYTILSIGRSLASCCETLRNMGANVKFLPMSDLRHGSFCGVTEEGVSAYGKYLSSIGLSKEQIRNNPTHKYIIMDYTESGESLRKVHEFLTWEELLSDAPNIETLSTEEALDFSQNLELSGRKLKRYSTVDRLEVDELENVFKASDPYKYDFHHYKDSYDHLCTKLFRLKMFEILDSNNELKSL